MTDLNPKGISRGGNFTGQDVRLATNDVPVDSALNEVRFTSPRGLTGFVGLTGLANAAQGNTGSAFTGPTGIRGFTGIGGATGVQGLIGITGFFGLQGVGFGITGLDGQTGIQNITGILGDTGFRGLTGLLGLQGATGLLSLQGVTGLFDSWPGVTGFQGHTGIESTTGLQGITGVAGVGFIGLQGHTGLQGVTGLVGTFIVDSQLVQSLTSIVTIPASTLTATGQQLEFFGSGFTSDDGTSVTISLALGSTTLFTREFGLIADTFIIGGMIIRTGATTQRIGLFIQFDSGIVYTNTMTAAESWAVALNLTLSITSTGDGYQLNQLTAKKIS
jgi:hypothetical protein